VNRIRELRKQKKLTQKELAKHLKIADSTLSYWEMGKYEPDNESLRKLSRFFLVPIDYILGGGITEWETGATFIGESKSEYLVDYENHDFAMFRREEFFGLTETEIQMLAQYAEFLKSQRTKDDTNK